jgi:hypothetical protein
MTTTFFFPTASGSAAQAIAPARYNLAGSTVTVEYGPADFSTILLTKTASLDSRGDVILALTSTEIDLVKDSDFRIKAVKNGVTNIVLTGRVNYSKPVTTGGSGVSDYTQLTNKPSLAAVATSGNYNDLTNKPTIPSMAVVGTAATPITDPNTARPNAETVYWKCASGVTPSHAANGDLIWNAS